MYIRSANTFQLSLTSIHRCLACSLRRSLRKLFSEISSVRNFLVKVGHTFFFDSKRKKIINQQQSATISHKPPVINHHKSTFNQENNIKHTPGYRITCSQSSYHNEKSMPRPNAPTVQTKFKSWKVPSLPVKCFFLGNSSTLTDSASYRSAGLSDDKATAKGLKDGKISK